MLQKWRLSFKHDVINIDRYVIDNEVHYELDWLCSGELLYVEDLADEKVSMFLIGVLAAAKVSFHGSFLLYL